MMMDGLWWDPGKKWPFVVQMVQLWCTTLKSVAPYGHPVGSL